MAKKKTISKTPKKDIKKHKKSTTKKVLVKKSNTKKIHKAYFIAPLIIIAIALFVILNPWAGDKETEVTDSVIASINGELVTLTDYEHELNKLDPQIRSVVDEATIMTIIINQKLLEQEAEKEEINVEDEINEILFFNNITMQELEENLEIQGLTMNDFTQILKINKLLDEKIFTELTVSEEEATEYYETNEEFFVMPESVRARHILIPTEERTDDEAITIINEVKLAFEENNSRFCELVVEYSDDTGSIDACGEYPAFTRDSNFVEEYKEAAFENEEGEYSVVKTIFGYHLIQTLEKVPEQKVSYEETAEDIKQEILYEKQKEAFDLYINELKEKAEIINCFETPEEKICQQKDELKETITGEVVKEQEDESLVEFAKCLTEKGAKLYTASWCGYCANQKQMFGEAIIHIENIRCDLEDNPGAQAPDCQEANIQGYPTWIINNNQYPGLQSFETLSKLSGCKL